MNKPRISMIAAVAENLAIGKNNKLLWNLPSDLQNFKKITLGHPVIMGSKTFESLGRPLPGRLNIVVAFNKQYNAPGATVVHSLEDALKQAESANTDEIFVIGGGSIYKQFLPMAHRLYITKVHKSFEGDVFFPDYSEFNKIISSQDSSENGLDFTWLVLEK